MSQDKLFQFTRMMNKMALYFPTQMSPEKIDAYWGLLKEYSTKRLAKAMETVVTEKSESYFPTVARIIKAMPGHGYGTEYLPNPYFKGKKAYVLSDLGMLWFALNCKYMAKCVKDREEWMYRERNARIIEWSGGLINEDNTLKVISGYEDYANSGSVSEQRFNYKEFLDVTFNKKIEKEVFIR